ncbi:MAG: hypothetical protein JO006_19250 [Paucibacter sp.]|nr:hypothetical protein [Roseateles sp.]
MKRFAVLLAFAASSAQAAEDFVCSGSSAIREFVGYYAHTAIIDSASRLRSWPAILKSTASDVAGLIVQNDNVFLSRSWHEGDTGGHCIKRDTRGIWVREASDPDRLLGPYRRVATPTENEALAYLALFMSGCYKSNDAKRWCFSRREITIDGVPFKGEFNLDTMELPEYGTSFRVPGGPLPLLVFAETAQGWAAYWDDFVTTEGRVPVVVGRSHPTFTLTKESQR